MQRTIVTPVVDKKYCNKYISDLFKEFLKLRKVTDAKLHDYKAEEMIKRKLFDFSYQNGYIAALSKLNLLKLLKMQSSLRFIALHVFLIHCAKACDSLTHTGDE